MKLLNVLLIISATLLFSSCSQERNFDRTQDKLTGTWRFHKVKFVDDSKLFSDDITDQYKKYRWVFTGGGDVMRIEPGISDTVFGTYDLEYQTYDVYDIQFHMINRNVDPYIIDRMRWVGACIHKKKFDAAQVVSKSKRYVYVMKKE